MFPRLTPAQVARVVAHGNRRSTRRGEVLFEAGDPAAPFFLVIAGQVEIVRPSGTGEELVAVHGPGQFTGEVNMLTGRRSLLRAQVSESGEVSELDRERLLAIVQTDSEISEILMRAFILRRVELIAQGFGDAILIGSTHCSGTLRVKEFLTRNVHPYTYIDLDRDADVQALLDRFQVGAADVPVLVCRGEIVLRNPTNQEIAACLGLNPTLDSSRVHDVVVVGAGPAGLATAVYAASEGLDVVMLEEDSPGGQAGSSSKIENYLGFPTGISGQALAGRALAQAQKFGAHVLIAKGATALGCDCRPYSVQIGDDSPLRARCVVIASGAEYRKPELENLSRFEGVGVYYAATFMEAQLCANEEVIVIGGGNSAGQAAVFLAQTARRVHILVRSGGLAETMSRYLVRRIEEHPAIELHSHTELIELAGETHLERVRWRNSQTGVIEASEVRHVFILAGAVAATQWLKGCLVVDDKDFVKTGADLSQEELAGANWPLARAPYLLETSLPGVFAVGRRTSGQRQARSIGCRRGLDRRFLRAPRYSPNRSRESRHVRSDLRSSHRH